MYVLILVLSIHLQRRWTVLQNISVSKNNSVGNIAIVYNFRTPSTNKPMNTNNAVYVGSSLGFETRPVNIHFWVLVSLLTSGLTTFGHKYRYASRCMAKKNPQRRRNDYECDGWSLWCSMTNVTSPSQLTRLSHYHRRRYAK